MKEWIKGEIMRIAARTKPDFRAALRIIQFVYGSYEMFFIQQSYIQ
jgi:hypothetical protein